MVIAERGVKMTVEKSVTIVYSWDSEEHCGWVKKLAEELERNSVQVTYDQNSLALGDDINQFMEIAVSTASIILAICTEQYKEKIDGREGGSGYEGRMMAQLVKNRSASIIPITKDGYKDSKIPRAFQGLTSIDLELDIKKEKFARLLQAIHGFKIVKDVKKVDPRKTIADALEVKLEEVKTDDELMLLNIGITNIISDKVTLPKMDGSQGSALYSIPFQLSESPTSRWEEYFIYFWNSPPRFTSMHRPGIASVTHDVLWLRGTTIEEVKKYHRDTLVLAIDEANKAYNKEIIETEKNVYGSYKNKIKLDNKLMMG
ncbi:hypothetical protein T481_09175 [Enterococcus faecalis PF3]|nr:hypothetical protein T481_09175 [Enterococcus faecalis PF3]